MRLAQPAISRLALVAVFLAWLFGGDVPLVLAYLLAGVHVLALVWSLVSRVEVAAVPGPDAAPGGRGSGAPEITLARGDRLLLPLAVSARAPWPVPVTAAWAPADHVAAHAFRPQDAPPALGTATREGARIELASGALPRGRLRVPSVAVEVSDPLGLIVRRETVDLGVEVLVAPRLRTIPEDAPLARVLRAADGSRSGVAFPDSANWSGLRPFRPGDDRRLIHWRSSARRGSLHVLDFHRTPARGLAVALDPDPAGRGEAWEEAIEAALALARFASGMRLPLWLWEPAAGVPGVPVPLTAATEVLSRVRPRRDPGFADRLLRIARTAPRPGLVAVVAASLPPARARDLARLAAGGPPVAVVSFDGPERVDHGLVTHLRYPDGDAFGPLARDASAAGVAVPAPADDAPVDAIPAAARGGAAG